MSRVFWIDHAAVVTTLVFVITLQYGFLHKGMLISYPAYMSLRDWLCMRTLCSSIQYFAEVSIK